MVGGLLQGFRDALRVRHMLRERPIDAISITSSGSLAAIRDVMVLGMARRRGISGYHHLRIGRLPDIIRRNGWEWRLLRGAMRSATAVVVLDGASEAALTSAMPDIQVRKIPNCISLDGISPAPDMPMRAVPEILYLGWMVDTKGVRELVEAWSDIVVPPSTLVLAGPGSPVFLQEVRQLAVTRGTEGRLEILGEIMHDEAMARMRRTDLFVLPSYTEGFPNVVAEAMAFSRPIVATTVGAIPEMLDGGNGTPCGVLVPPRDVSSLRTAIKSLLADPTQRQELGRRARIKVETAYTAPKVFDRLVNLWQGQ